MNIVEKKQDDVMLLEIHGRLDTTNYRELEDRMINLMEKEKKIIIDCKEMNYISSAGMRVFLMALKHLKNNDGQLRLSGLTDDTKQIFDVAGFATFFDIYNTAEEAIRFF